jgi:transposase
MTPRSKGVISSVKVPIDWEQMTKRQRSRLSRITSRDTRVIKAYLGVIARHETDITIGTRKKRIHKGALDKLTLTALRHRDPSKRRTTVPHDFKERFPNTSFNELQECRDIAVAMWNRYLEGGGSIPLQSDTHQQKKIPRNIFPGRFELIHIEHLCIQYWLEIRDSLDSIRQGRRVHDKLMIPLKVSPFHKGQLSEGRTKSCKIVKDSQSKWWAIFAVETNVSKNAQVNGFEKSIAVLGIDLGIDKAACVVFLRKDSISPAKYFYQNEKDKSLNQYEERIASLQAEMQMRENNGRSYDKLAKKLRELSHKRGLVKKEWDRVLVRQIIDYAKKVSQQYYLYVGVGNPKGIRNIARRGEHTTRKTRRTIHRWSYARVIRNLEHGFSKLGWTVGKPGSRFLAVYEGYTSIICHRCGHRGIRPKQSLFVCPTCGTRVNADKNGAINIARRMIRLTPELRDEINGLGRWLFSREKPSRPKAVRRKSSFKRKSSLLQKSPALHNEESAVVHDVQMDLPSFGDKTGLGDEDPAVEKAAEELPVSECLDSPRSGALGVEQQQKDATNRKRSHAPMTTVNAHVASGDERIRDVSDDSHELGGTQEL